MRIGLDFDGVIADSLALKTLAAKELFGVDVAPERFKKEIVVGEGILTHDQYRELQKLVYGSFDLGARMAPVEGMLQAVRQLQGDGHDLRVVTTRDGVMLDVARAWTERQGLALEFVGVGYGISKADATAGMDLFVDDDLDKLEPLVGVVPHRLLFSWHYNAHLDAGSVATRVASWKEIMEKVGSLVPVR